MPGNNNANELWEAKNRAYIQAYKQQQQGRSGQVDSATYGTAIRESFIRDKYSNHTYLAPVYTPAEANILLLKAAKSGIVLQLYIALINKADVNVIASIDDSLYTPLHICCYYNYITCIELLLLWNASTDEVDVRGETALDVAMGRKHVEAAKIVEVYSKRG